MNRYSLRPMCVLVAWSALSAVVGAQVQITSSPALAATPQIVARGTDLYMAVDTGSGRQLRRFDTILRTTSTIVDGVTAQPIVGVQEPTVVGTRVFFKGNPNAVSAPSLYVHDPALGNVAAKLVATTFDPLFLTASGNQLFCSGTGAGGREPWVSDGTVAGTRPVSNLNLTGDSNPQGFVAYGGGVLFSANDGSNGVEPWFAAGTTLTLLQVRAGSMGSDPREFVVSGGFCYFSANNGVLGRELWRTAGTVATTTGIDVRQGSQGSDPTGLCDVAGSVYFAANGGINHGVEVWRTTGVGLTVVEEIDIRPNGSSVPSSDPTGITWAPPFVYLAATSSGNTGRELFRYDPVPRVLVPLNVQQGPAAGVRDDPHITPLGAGGTVVFEGNDGSTDWEPWSTSGVAVTNAANLAQPGSSDPEQFTPTGSEVFFVATNNTGTGVQVWAMPFSGLDSAIWSVRGNGCPRVGGTVPTDTLSAVPRIGTTPSLVTQGAASLGLVLGFAATQPGTQAVGVCTVSIATGGSEPIALPIVVANGAGTATLPFPIPFANSLIGFRVLMQSLVLEPGGAMLGIGALTNAIDAFVGT